MKLRRRRMPVLQPPKARLYILCLFLAAGVLAGFLAGRTVASEDLLSLSRYVTGYARLNAEEPRSAGLWQVLWTYLRYPAAAFLLLTALCLIAVLTLLKLLKLAQAFEQAAVVVKLQVYLGLCDVYAVIIIAAHDCRNQHFVCLAVLTYGNGVLSGGDYVLYFRFCRYLNATDVKVCDAIMGSGKTQAAIV